MGVIVHVPVPGITIELVWCAQINANVIVALENHTSSIGLDHIAGHRWRHDEDPEDQLTSEPPDHILAAAMRLTLEGKLTCED